MIVTEVIKKRNNVFVDFDNGEQIIIPYELFVNYYLVKGDELSSNSKNELQKKVDLYKIKQSSFRYLSGRNHSRYELKVKLIKKKYSQHYIDLVLDELEEQKFINDENFARSFFIIQLNKQKGLLKIKADLARKGVKREIIDNISIEFGEDEKFITSIKSLINKKLVQLKNRNTEKSKIKYKIYQFLVGRGFTPDLINRALKELNIENSNE